MQRSQAVQVGGVAVGGQVCGGADDLTHRRVQSGRIGVVEEPANGRVARSEQGSPVRQPGRLQEHVAPGPRSESLCEHRAILDAIGRRQAEQAEQLAREHVVRTTEQLLEAMRALQALPPAAND